MGMNVAKISTNESEEDIGLFNKTEKQLNIIEEKIIKLENQNHFESDNKIFSDIHENINIVRILLQYPVEKIDHLFFRDLQEIIENIQVQYEELLRNNQILKQAKDAMRTIDTESAEFTGAKILDFPTKNNPPIKQNITASNDEFYEKFKNVTFLKAHNKIFRENEEIRSNMQSKVSGLIQERQPQQDFIKNATEKQRDAIDKIIKTDTSMGILKSDLNIMQAANDMSYQIEKEEAQKTPEKPSSFWGKVKNGFKNLFGK